MPVTYVNTTTLSADLSASARRFGVASTANFTVGQYIAVGQELMLVQVVVNATTVEAERGVGGTLAVPHLSGITVYGSSATAFGGNAVYVNGQYRVPLVAGTGSVYSLPQYFLPLGSRANDELGNVFVLCDFTTTVYPKQPVTINSNYQAGALDTTGRGTIGVVAEQVACTSDNWGWVQVFGRCKVLLGMSGVSPSDAANGPTTLSTSAQTRFMLGTSLTSPNGIGWTSETSTSGFIIRGMTVATDASPGDVSGTTSGTGHTGGEIAVWLNFPDIFYNEGTST